MVRVIAGVPSCVGVPGVGVEGPVGVWEREEALERGGSVIALRKRSFSGIFAVFVFVICFVVVINRRACRSGRFLA